jgi:hypothetical protein
VLEVARPADAEQYTEPIMAEGRDHHDHAAGLLTWDYNKGDD